MRDGRGRNGEKVKGEGCERQGDTINLEVTESGHIFNFHMAHTQVTDA